MDKVSHQAGAAAEERGGEGRRDKKSFHDFLLQHIEACRGSQAYNDAGSVQLGRNAFH